MMSPNLAPAADERTGLLARSAGTGRTYRDSRGWRRRRSVPASGLGGGGSSVGLEGAGEGRRASQGHSRTQSQDATGGWWRMRRWWKIARDGGRKSSGDSEAVEEGNNRGGSGSRNGGHRRDGGEEV